MKKKMGVVGMLCILSLFLFACGQTSNERYKEAMERGEVAIDKKQFDKAIEGFDAALDVKGADTLARSYKEQTETYIRGMNNVSRELYQDAIEEFDKVIRQKIGLVSLAEYAEESKKDTEEIVNALKKQQSTDKQNGKELWDKDKNEALTDFMELWGASMNQEYHAYTPTNNVDFYGVEMPQSVLNGDAVMLLQDKVIPLEWSKTGVGESSYQLVAVYSDSETKNYLQEHLYFFTFVHDKPKVFISQQSPSQDDDTFVFTETDNEQLKQAFEKLSKGEEVDELEEDESDGLVKSEASARKVIFKRLNEEVELNYLGFNHDMYEFESLPIDGITTIYQVQEDGTIWYNESYE